MLQEVDPIRAAASGIRMREGLACRGTKRPEDVALGAAAVINLLLRPLGRSPAALYQGTPSITFGAHWPHLVKTDHTTARGRCGVERLNRPLIWADPSVKCWSQGLP
jgi:hypothetical protein